MTRWALATLWCALAFAQRPNVPHKATGAFDVRLTPAAGSGSVGRVAIVKQFHGPLDAVSTGQMLTAMTETKGSAGYVAIELVRGALDGRKGTFMLQHSGIMNRGTPELSITVVPDSGTGELTGLAGRMNVRIEAGGRHFYDFEYSLAR